MSASESILPDEKSKPQSACFRASAEFMQKPHITDGPDDYRLVHGNVAALPQDVAVNHAWVEEIDFVYELDDGHESLFSKDEYYKINNVRTYTAQEATTLIGVYGHWGQWN